MPTPGRQLEHEDFAPAGTGLARLSILVDNFTAPANVGAVFRSADAFGAGKLYLCGDTICPPNSKLRRLSRAAEKYVAWEHRDDALALVRELRAAGTCIISLEITEHSRPLNRFTLPDGPVCLILGAEDRGVAPALLAESHAVVHIPMGGSNSSLNVGSACAVALYQFASVP
ncbi:RNA methyltransferase [Simiduia agarivorans]|uniref:tRNA/rRNA methyltransferase SpoU n=1 Tax=Simiduia agarivorans (strain DSM 21679 / JCM 13881 / BCRC 17597 / SA1) TaxID=1117647 RepID=K4KJB0_SIMAS|nr:RNA methyltransferase [Simiduia agarivorans]AFU99214.1 tRNA/rRNA methyltransferase SpoU [Simiduia agarivorans SA1 = DSM 21679]